MVFEIKVVMQLLGTPSANMLKCIRTIEVQGVGYRARIGLSKTLKPP
jgi:hypothetical protein